LEEGDRALAVQETQAVKEDAETTKAAKIAAREIAAVACTTACSCATTLPTNDFPLVGCCVELNGLVQHPASLDGLVGMAECVTDVGCYLVRIAGSGTVNVHPANLRVAPTSPASTTSSAVALNSAAATTSDVQPDDILVELQAHHNCDVLCHTAETSSPSAASAHAALVTKTGNSPTSSATLPTPVWCRCQPFCRAPVERPWSDTHHWREQDPAATSQQHLRMMRRRAAALRWMLGEAPEGSCEMCLQLPTYVAELACGHWLCHSCMHLYVANRNSGRACMACRARTIRPEVSWIRWAVPPTEEQRNARRDEWERTRRNPITIIYQYQPPQLPLLPLQPPPLLPPVQRSAPLSSQLLSPQPSQQPSRPPSQHPPLQPPPLLTETDELRLVIDHLRAKLLKQSYLLDEQQLEHMEKLAVQEVRHNLELVMVSEELSAAEKVAESAAAAASSQVEAVLELKVARLQEQVKTLEGQLGGSNWLTARSSFEARGVELKATKQKLQELNDLLAVGPRLRAKGDVLSATLATEASCRKAGLQEELQAEVPSSAKDVQLTERRVDQLAAHLEQQLFHAGAGSIPRTQLLAKALMRRPAVQRILKQNDRHWERLNEVMKAMVDSVKGVLDHLTTGRGSRTTADQERFEVIVAALTPDNARQLNMISVMAEILGIHHEPIERAVVRHALCRTSAAPLCENC